MVSVPNYNPKINYPQFVGSERKPDPVLQYIKPKIEIPKKQIIKPTMMSKPIMISKPSAKPITIPEPQIKMNKQKKVLEKINKHKKAVFVFIVIVASSMMVM